MARPARFERTAFRLGGGCSILLSYWRICILHCNEKIPLCQQKAVWILRWISLHFSVDYAYTITVAERRRASVRETNDPYADLDDLIFDEDDGGPSQR